MHCNLYHLALLLVSFRSVTIFAWVNTFPSSFSRVAVPRKSIVLFSTPDSNTNSNGDDDCEEECEIDWSAMPGWEDEEEEEELTISEELVSAVLDDDDDDEESVEVDDTLNHSHTLTPPPAQKFRPHVSQMRLRLEMQWQLAQSTEDCDVDKPQTCGSEKCHDCHGRGWNHCRFCHGTAVLWLKPSTSFTACPVCHQGVEVCHSCKGSGWIARWTQLQESAH